MSFATPAIETIALTKVYGSRSPKNVVKAVMVGLVKLQNKETIEALRGVQIEA